MTFQELPWLIFGLFLRGGFGSHSDPDKTPVGGSNIVGMFLLAWLILAVVLTAQVIRRDVTVQHLAVKGRATPALTCLTRSHDPLARSHDPLAPSSAYRDRTSG